MSAGRGKATTALAAVAIIVGMVGLTAASVPLYRIFCQVTGFGGTTRLAADDAAPEAVPGRTMRVRFNADAAPDLGWSFAPAQRAIEVPLGEQTLAFYRAVNRSDRPVVGTATFNVTPHKAGPYVAKIDCFCFSEQVLAPGEAVDMPVSFFVDPALLDDPEAADLVEITLSYTFFKAPDQSKAVAAVPVAPQQSGG